ncbi:MAG: MFS transporter [Acidimicrobiales bacterium]
MTSGGTVEGRRLTLITVTLMVGVAATSFPTTVLVASLERIRVDMHTDLATISWVQVAPSIGFALGMPLFGKLGDLYGHRRIYVTGFAVATVFSVLTALAWNPLSLILARTVSQIGGGATGTAAIALVAAQLPASQRARAIGLLNVAGGLAPVLGVVIGGPAVDAIGWRALFVIQAVPAFIAWCMALPLLSETQRRPDVRFDTAGAFTLGVGVTSAMFAINRVRPWGIDNPFVIATIVLTPLAMASFIRTEQRARFPLLPLHYLRRRSFSASATTMLFMQASFIGSFVLAPLMLQRLFGYSVGKTSLFLITRPFGFAAGAWVAGHHHDTRSVKKLQIFGNAALIVGSAFMVIGPIDKSIWLIEVGLVVTGFANGYARTVIYALVADTVDTADIGIATGVLNMLSQIGSASGTTIMSAVIADSYAASTMGWAFGVALFIALLTVPAVAFYNTRDQRVSVSADSP